MIYRLRMDGFGDSADDLEREFDTMTSHFASVGNLEGIVPADARYSDAEGVIETMKPSEEIRVGGHRYGPRYKGRRTIEFSTREGDFERLIPRHQEGYEVRFKHPGSADEDAPWAIEGHVMVVGRLMPMVSLGDGSEVLRTEESGPFTIWVREEPNAPVEYVRLGCSVQESVPVESSGDGMASVMVSTRVEFEAVVPVAQREPEVDRLMAAARLYVKQAMGITGDDRLDTCTQGQRLHIVALGKTGSSGSTTTDDLLTAIRSYRSIGSFDVVPANGGRWSITFTTLSEHRPRGIAADSLHEAAQKVFDILCEREGSPYLPTADEQVE